MYQKIQHKNPHAFSVLELILAAGLFSIFAVSIALAVFQASNTQQKTIQLQMARQFAAEGIEAARALRSQSFDALSDTTGSGIQFSNDNKWELHEGNDSWQGFTRIITIQSAQRDADKNIVLSDGDSVDSDMKLVTSAVTQGNISVEFSVYLSRRDITPIIPPPTP